MANLQEIGQTLKEAREAHGLTLEELSHRTHVSMRHLRAIEDGNEADLPEVFYVRGFLKKYAEAVGLSPTDVADAYSKAPIPTPTEPSMRYSVGPIAYYLLIVVVIVGVLALAWHFQPHVSVVSSPSPTP
ncbi:MAG TPA: helix-turn-helix transcriptional regulator, partial [Oscillatoriaceae cyanobacterium]